MKPATRGIRVFIGMREMACHANRGGTFTDTFGMIPDASEPSGFRTVVVKLLSVDPKNYPDAPREAIRRIQPVPTTNIELIRMGTTVATNALLERKGEPLALLITKGFKNLLHIGNQSRPNIFDLNIRIPSALYDHAVEVDERVTLVGYSASDSGFNVQVPKDDPNYVQGVTGEWVRILKRPDLHEVERQLRLVYSQGIRSVAICLMHSFTFPEHERLIGDLAKKIGFANISLSSAVMPVIKIVPRGNSSVTDGYLTPSIQAYIQGFFSGFDEGIRNGKVRVEFMQSDGGLAPVGSFSGLRAILSGPAAGVVGYALTSFEAADGTPIIGFDMGGTSTDVSRFAGTYEHVFETTTAGITIQAAQLDINTVAAGGGSRLFYRNGMFVVGPESAGANPGPACYKKGGPLAITDANLLLGRLVPSYFPHIFGPTEKEPLDFEATNQAFAKLVAQIEAENGGKTFTLDEIAYGFVKVANEAMCRPIRALTQAKGYNTSKHALACFGGAGGQHACAIARSLGIKTILIHRYAAILSAYGLSLADVVHEVREPRQENFTNDSLERIKSGFAAMAEQAADNLKTQGFSDEQIVVEEYLNLRYQGTDTSMMILKPENSWNFVDAFIQRHRTEFGFTLPDRPIVVDDLRVRAIGKGIGSTGGAKVHQELKKLQRHHLGKAESESLASVYWEDGGRQPTPIFLLGKLSPGTEILGPALIIDQTSTIAVEPACTAVITSEHVVISVGDAISKSITVEADPIMLSVFGHRFMSIAEQMGRTLQKTAISTNIKERLDFSCALFGPDGGLSTLASMQEAVRWQMLALKDDLHEGDVIMTNHPSAGGSHLPDITIITPVFNKGKIEFFVASRGHHADIGGIQPGSMPPNSCELFQEGAAVKSFKIVKAGKFDEDGLTDILFVQPGKYPGCSGTRCLSDNLSDLKAQVAANQRGITLVKDLIQEYGLDVVQAYMHHIRGNAELAVRNLLKDFAKTQGRHVEAEDYMDDGSTIRLSITVDEATGNAIFDFTGTSPEVYGNTNAPKSVTYSAIIYCLRCLVNLDMPLNQGALQPITVVIPEGSMLCPSETAAVVGGNVLTSQRLCDVILRAFKACAASQGRIDIFFFFRLSRCCNNFTFGSGGKDEAGNVKAGFGYYETIGLFSFAGCASFFLQAGGSGAGPTWDGRSGVEFLEPLNVSLLSERRVFAPYGQSGGRPGKRGLNLLIRAGRKEAVNFGGKNATVVRPGDRIRIETPGGGGRRRGEEADHGGGCRARGGGRFASRWRREPGELDGSRSATFSSLGR
ncbi:Hydantoinase B/oxoprolinase-domain-containing protein [Zopfochytrium polystomum]|nr:Hydantoinase B/oxoprolinase-domain-containing protein [Zopfochytrium polystomum]